MIKKKVEKAYATKLDNNVKKEWSFWYSFQLEYNKNIQWYNSMQKICKHWSRYWIYFQICFNQVFNLKIAHLMINMNSCVFTDMWSKSVRIGLKHSWKFVLCLNHLMNMVQKYAADQYNYCCSDQKLNCVWCSISYLLLILTLNFYKHHKN